MFTQELSQELFKSFQEWSSGLQSGHVGHECLDCAHLHMQWFALAHVTCRMLRSTCCWTLRVEVCVEGQLARAAQWR
jgi:hypothetical protein